MSKTEVSVIIPCHDAAGFLGDALRSVAQQSLRDFECIIVDDASTDGSAAIAQSFVEEDRRFQLLSLPQNGGASAARNAGIDRATGKWIALLDADDLYLPDRLDRLAELGERETADMVVDEQLVTQFPDAAPGHLAFGFAEAAFTITQEDYFDRSRLFGRTLALGYMKPVIRRDFLRHSGVRFDSDVLSGEDFLFYGQLFANRPHCVGTDRPGYIYRRRAGSLSRSDTHLHFHARLGDRLLEAHGSSLSQRSRSGLARRRREIDRLVDALPALAAARQRDWPSALRALAATPSAILTCMSVARRKLSRALAGRQI